MVCHMTTTPRARTKVSIHALGPDGRRYGCVFPHKSRHLECVAGPVGEGVPIVVVCETKRDLPPKFVFATVERARRYYHNVILEQVPA